MEKQSKTQSEMDAICHEVLTYSEERNLEKRSVVLVTTSDVGSVRGIVVEEAAMFFGLLLAMLLFVRGRKSKDRTA